MAAASTVESMTCFGPRDSKILWATDLAMPLSSIILPNTAPSMNTGKKFFTYVTALAMNSSVYVGITGSPCMTAARTARIGAKKMTEYPR